MNPTINFLLFNPWFNFIATVPFAFWYIHKYQLLVELMEKPGKTTASITRRFGRTVNYQFQDATGKTYTSQYKFPGKAVKTLAASHSIDIAFLRSNPKYNYPWALLEHTRKMTYLIRNIMIIFSIISLVPLLAN